MKDIMIRVVRSVSPPEMRRPPYQSDGVFIRKFEGNQNLDFNLFKIQP